MQKQQSCPECRATNIYEYGGLWSCPDCGHDWTAGDVVESVAPVDVVDAVVRDANGNALNDGDSVIVIKELKVKGSSATVRNGTKVKNIRLIESDDGHDIACKIDGIGAINLKSQFVRKA